jgi:chromosome segregation ATPase
MSDTRRQLRNAKKLVRLRLVQQSQASQEVAEANRRVRASTEAVSAAASAIDNEDATFRAESPRWSSISSFEAALEKRTSRTAHAQAQREALEGERKGRDQAIEGLRGTDARLSCAEQMVLTHRTRLRHALERLEQSLTDDLSVLKRSQDS